MIRCKMLLTGRNANLILPQYAVYSQVVQKLEIDSLSGWNIQSIIDPDFITEWASVVCIWGTWYKQPVNKEGAKLDTR